MALQPDGTAPPRRARAAGRTFHRSLGLHISRGYLGRLLTAQPAFAAEAQAVGVTGLASGPYAHLDVIERAPVRGTYRGHEIVSMAPVSSGGTHLVQLLHLLSGFDLAASGFGTARTIHLLAEALRIAFADWHAFMADPATTPVPVAWLTSLAYADERRAEIEPERARPHAAGPYPGGESASTTHVTTADAQGLVVCATQTLNDLFGAKVMTPGTGLLLNNTMALMDPTPGRTNSVAGKKRILSCMAPTLVLKDGAPLLALGTPGGRRIFGALMQAIVNVLDHGMTLQEAVEAPRVWTEGPLLEVEDRFPHLPELVSDLEAMGHRVQVVPKVAGGMNGVRWDAARGLLHGAACWRADGAPMGISGGPAWIGDAAPAHHGA